MRTKGDQAAAIASAVIDFLRSQGFVNVADELDEDYREELEEEIFRAA